MFVVPENTSDYKIELPGIASCKLSIHPTFNLSSDYEGSAADIDLTLTVGEDASYLQVRDNGVSSNQ